MVVHLCAILDEATESMKVEVMTSSGLLKEKMRRNGCCGGSKRGQAASEQREQHFCIQDSRMTSTRSIYLDIKLILIVNSISRWT